MILPINIVSMKDAQGASCLAGNPVLFQITYVQYLLWPLSKKKNLFAWLSHKTISLIPE